MIVSSTYRVLLASLVSAALLISNETAHAAIVASGLIQDLNPDVGVATSGSNVTTWTNQGSAGDDVATNDGAPQLLTSALLGHNVVAFSGDRLVGDDGAAFDSLMTGSGHTWFSVVRVNPGDNGGAKNAMFGTLLNGSPFSGFVAHVGDAGGLDTTGSYLNRPGGSDVFTVGNVEIADQQYHIIAGRLDAGTGAQTAGLYIDSPVVNATSSPSISAATNSGPIAVGAEQIGGGERIDGYLARVLIYDRPLTNAEMLQTGAALAEEYGLSNGFGSFGDNTESIIWNFDQGVLSDTTGTYDFNIASGTAFGTSPITYAGSDANNPFGGAVGLVRSDFLNNGAGQTKPGDGPQGSLESDVFTLGSDASFVFEGSGNGGVLELVDAGSNAVLASVVPGRTSTTLEAFSLDASAFAGQDVFLRIVDNSSGGWGHIAVDNIIYTASTVSAAVPEPGSLLLTALPLGIVAGWRRKRR
jgi:hypothetical protein